VSAKPPAPSSAASASGAALSPSSAGASAKPVAPASAGGAGTGQPIKIGVLLPLSGPTAAIGKEDLQGMQLALAQFGDEIAGRKLQVVQADDQNTPNVALTEARRLVEEEHVSVIMGSLNSAVALAIAPYIAGKQIPYLTGGIAKALTQSQKSPYVFRASQAAGQAEGVLGYYLYHTASYRKGIFMGSDYAAGHDSLAAVQATFTPLGGSVVTEVFPRQNETDYSPFLSKGAGQQADFTYGYFFGADTLRFIKQYRQFGVKPHLIMTAASVSAAGVPEQLGKDVDGIITPELWDPSLEAPISQAFVKAYKDRFGSIPSSLSENGYVSMEPFLLGAKAVNGKVEDSAALVKAMNQVTFEGPAGKWQYDSANNPIVTIYVVQWGFENGKPVSKIIDKVENVSQDWTPPKQ